MRTEDGTKVCVTPSVLYGPDCAMVAFDGGENGYMHVKVDGAMADFKFFYSDMELIEQESHAWGENAQLFHGDNRALECARAMLSFMSACVESRHYVHTSGEMGENADLFDTKMFEWFDQTELDTLIEEITEEIGVES